MGGEGSGNAGRKKFGNKFYSFTGRYDSKERADHTAEQYENNGIRSKVVQEIHELPWYPFKEVPGWSVYVIPVYRRKTQREKNLPASGIRKRW